MIKFTRLFWYTFDIGLRIKIFELYMYIVYNNDTNAMIIIPMSREKTNIVVKLIIINQQILNLYL